MEFHEPPAGLDLQPLRIPAGWAIGWNTLYATSRTERGEFGGSSLFNATNAGRRFCIDVAFRPEFDPDGRFHLTVEYQPWPRTARGGRRTDMNLRFDGDAETVHAFDTASFPELVDQLEAWIARCSAWAREGN
ncbi:hypothetical protein BH10PSE14_BH10PSE14_30820 [soil metagenome]